MSMKAILLLILPCALGLVSCTLPDTPLWNSRESGVTSGMPAELVTKVVLHGTLKSVVNNPVTTVHKGVSMITQRSLHLSENLLTEIDLLNLPEQKGAQIEQGLDAIGLPKPLPGKVELLLDGPEFFPALRKAMNDAQDQIDFQFFIFDNDDVATDIADHLKAHSKEVRCRVLMDRMGSVASWWSPPTSPLPPNFKSPSSMPHYLRENSKVKVRQSQNPWLVADHSKLVLIDGKEAYLGGMNTGREYLHEWHDLMVRVTGPIVSTLQDQFNVAWKLQGPFGDFQAALNHREKVDTTWRPPGHFPIRILRTSQSRVEIERAILAAIRWSRERIYTTERQDL